MPHKLYAIKLLMGALLLTACSGPGYYAQAISGQWKLSHARQPISELTADPKTDAELVQRLQTASGIIVFAATELDLPANGSYSSYVDLQRDAVTWNVIATPAYSLVPKKWCFLVAGCFPYRGFFKQSAAQSSASKYDKRGWDTYISPATAYSTLGKFNDPLLSTMFKGSDVRLAAFLFHELAHQRIYVKDDGRFNENYASFLEQVGISRWLEASNRQEELQKWQKMQQVEKQFAAFIKPFRFELASMYQSGLADTEKSKQKVIIFDMLQNAYQVMVKNSWNGQDYYKRWFESPLNNARLALFDTYDGGQCAFEHLYIKAKGNIMDFNHLAGEQAKLPKLERDKWLNQMCPVVAPATDL
jgi:predicted aminopeptidase